MRMRQPSSRCFPHTVIITHNTWGTDPDGGRIVTATDVITDVVAFVQQDEPQELIEVNEETGDRRVTQIVPTKILFAENPQLSLHDLVTWVDFDTGLDPTTHLIRIFGSRNVIGLASVWQAIGEERI
jgi:hypothetical protein